METKSKRGRRKGPEKVPYYRRVVPSLVPILDSAIKNHKPGDISIPGDVALKLTKESKTFGEFQEKVKPYLVPSPTPKGDNASKGLETPKRPPLKLAPEVAAVVRPNFFKK